MNTLECQAVIQGRAISLLTPPGHKGSFLYWVLLEEPVMVGLVVGALMKQLTPGTPWIGV